MTANDAQMPGTVPSLFGLARPADRGRWGERVAEEYLRRERGWRILERNWRNPRDRREEIDLVARDGAVWVFVEVKVRAPGARVPGYYAVDGRKRRVLRRAIRGYLALLPERPRTFRCDVVEVVPAGRQPELRHFENVGLFTKYFRP